MDTKQILDTSDEAAKFTTKIEGWVDRNGRFWGNNEATARWSGCTHVRCESCGKPTEKRYTTCKNCREKKAIERYEARERVQWDLTRPLYSEAADEYFFDWDALIDYIDEHGGTLESLRLVLCEPNNLRQIDEDYFCDDLSEEGELPKEVWEALEKLNDVIRAQEPVSWYPGKYAVTVGQTPASGG